MDISTFVRSLYLGDRACKSITIDGWQATVRIQVDRISRVRSPSGDWAFYTDEDIVDGVLVFADVESLELRNSGHVPNDVINSVDVLEHADGTATLELSIDSVGSIPAHFETFLRIRCKSLHLEDPNRPGLKITT